MASLPCAHCGELIPEDATFCKHCGSDHETGWNPDIDYHSVEIPEYLIEDAEPPNPPQPVVASGRFILIAILIVMISVACVADIGGLGKYALGTLFFGWLLFVVFRR